MPCVSSLAVQYLESLSQLHVAYDNNYVFYRRCPTTLVCLLFWYLQYVWPNRVFSGSACRVLPWVCVFYQCASITEFCRPHLFLHRKRSFHLHFASRTNNVCVSIFREYHGIASYCCACCTSYSSFQIALFYLKMRRSWLSQTEFVVPIAHF